jgi:hypothetical protein
MWIVDGVDHTYDMCFAYFRFQVMPVLFQAYEGEKLAFEFLDHSVLRVAYIQSLRCTLLHFQA